MKRQNHPTKILVSITGSKNQHWQTELQEINEFNLNQVALFLECFTPEQRQLIYPALIRSCVKNIPLVHIRNDMLKSELEFLVKNFSSQYFTIHEDSFTFIQNWSGFEKNLYLEMNTDNLVSQSVKIQKIGGFCVDLAHFKISVTAKTQEAEYILQRKDISRYFACNHLNGYDPKRNTDLHTITSLQDFDYLKTLPKFLFSKVIAIETENSIKEQIDFRDYLSGFLDTTLAK